MTNSLKCKLDLPSFLKLRMVFGTCNNFLFIYFAKSFNIDDKVSKVIFMTIWVSLDHGMFPSVQFLVICQPDKAFDLLWNV